MRSGQIDAVIDWNPQWVLDFLIDNSIIHDTRMAA